MGLGLGVSENQAMTLRNNEPIKDHDAGLRHRLDEIAQHAHQGRQPTRKDISP